MVIYYITYDCGVDNIQILKILIVILIMLCFQVSVSRIKDS